MPRQRHRWAVPGALLALVLSGLALPSGAAGATDSARADAPPVSDVTWRGEPSSGTASTMSSTPCDVNADGFDDAVVGAWFWDKGALSNIGGGYVLLGSADPEGGDLTDPTSAGAVRIDGPDRAGATVGFSVSCLGDVNGDGYDDIALSEYSGQRVHVVYGAKNFTPVSLERLGDRGFVVQAGADAGNFGYSIAPAGDVDGDGLDDFMVSAVVADTRDRTNNGRIWVIKGREGLSDVEVAEGSPSVLGVIDGHHDQDRLSVMSAAGDVNGDGVDDIVLGSYVATPHGPEVSAPGAGYVLFGGSGFGNVDLADIGDRGFEIRGGTRGRDRLGISVSAAGDVDGDGKADVLLGAAGVGNAATGPRPGGAAVVFGSDRTGTVGVEPQETEAVTDSAGVRGYWIDGVADDDATGYAVAGLDDVTGDGVPDQLIGAYAADVEVDGQVQSTVGSAFVAPGQGDGATVDLADTDGVQRIDGETKGERFGRSVASLGDMDGNGVADYAVGGDSTSGDQSGVVRARLVGAVGTTTTTSIAPTSVTVAERARLTATVTPKRGRAPSAGTVAFSLDGTPVKACAAVKVTDGTATCGITPGKVGSRKVTAVYSGSATHSGSTATATSLTVKALTTTSRMTITPTTAKPNGTVTVKVAVDSERGTPRGRVDIRRGTTVLKHGWVVDGVATITIRVPGPPVKYFHLNARYAGSGAHGPSSVAPQKVEVRK